MRYVAITAAVFGVGLFMNPTSHAPIADSQHFNSIIKSTIPTAQFVVPKVVQPAAPVLAAISASPKPAAPTVVTVAVGDNLTAIAETNGTSPQRLYDANPLIADPNIIMPGQELHVPSGDEALVARPMPTPPPAVATTPAITIGRSAAIVPSIAEAVPNASIWDALARCESGGNWTINTGNGFYGGLQFTTASWQAVGGSGMPNQASREEQIVRGQLLQARGGWGNWPACSAKLGL